MERKTPRGDPAAKNVCTCCITYSKLEKTSQWSLKMEVKGYKSTKKFAKKKIPIKLKVPKSP